MLARKWLEQGAFKCRRYRRAPSLRAGNGWISAARRTPITARDPNRCKAGIVLAVMAFHQPGPDPATARGEGLAGRNLLHACHLRCCALGRANPLQTAAFVPNSNVLRRLTDAITSRYREKSIAVLGTAFRAISEDHLETWSFRKPGFWRDSETASFLD
jgi:hypothetical protein